MLRDVLMWPPSWLFAVLVGAKNHLYDHGILKPARLSAPVISVGNLAMGGTGKTPVTVDLVRRALARNLRVAVLSRGYGRRLARRALRVDPQGDWRDYGDEPLMIARRHPDAMVCVGPSRKAAAEVLTGQPVDLFILDDGFQHRKLHRDLDLVLVNVSRGLPKPFPRGLFREGSGALRRADAVAFTKSKGERDLLPWVETLDRVNPELVAIVADIRTQEWALLDGAPLDRASLRAQPIAAFAGIAHPEQFFEMLRDQGLSPVETLALEDHRPYAGETARRFEERCARAGVRLIVTTEKDAVKLDRHSRSAILKAFLAIDIQWKDEEKIEGLLDRVTQ